MTRPGQRSVRWNDDHRHVDLEEPRRKPSPTMAASSEHFARVSQAVTPITG